MKAAVRKKYGPASVLKIQDLPVPEPKANQVMINVKVATVNRTDCAVLSGKPFIMRLFTGLLRPKLISTGTDFSGIVEAVGSKVTSFKVGDRVFGFNDNGIGSHADYICIKESTNIKKISDKVSLIDAAASAEGAHYAINFLNKVEISDKHRVLLNGATGAIGSAMLQMLKNKGVFVTATANSKNIEKIKHLGADRVIDFMYEDFTRDHQEYDFILDAVGKSTFEQCRPIMNEESVYISSELGPNMQNPILALTTKNKKQRVVFPVPTDIPKSLDIMADLLEKKKFQPVIDRRYSLYEITEAFEYVNSGQKTGNVVIIMD